MASMTALVKYSLTMLSYLPSSYASCADPEGIPVFNAQEDWLDYEVVLQIERISSDLAYIGDKVDAKWAEHGFEFKCEYLNETIVYPLADIQSWSVGWVEPENEALVNPDKDSTYLVNLMVLHFLLRDIVNFMGCAQKFVVYCIVTYLIHYMTTSI